MVKVKVRSRALTRHFCACDVGRHFNPNFHLSVCRILFCVSCSRGPIGTIVPSALGDARDSVGLSFDLKYNHDYRPVPFFYASILRALQPQAPLVSALAPSVALCQTSFSPPDYRSVFPILQPTPAHRKLYYIRRLYSSHEICVRRTSRRFGANKRVERKNATRNCRRSHGHNLQVESSGLRDARTTIALVYHAWR